MIVRGNFFSHRYRTCIHKNSFENDSKMWRTYTGGSDNPYPNIFNYYCCRCCHCKTRCRYRRFGYSNVYSLALSWRRPLSYGNQTRLGFYLTGTNQVSEWWEPPPWKLKQSPSAVSALFYQIFIFSPNDGRSKLLLFSRYSDFCNIFPSFPHPDSKGRLGWNNLWCHELACINLLT